MNRAKNLELLKTQTFDLCIIGAGASGAGVALDATLRGLKVALIDQHDFSSETSSKSTKLIHGGVRYLEQAFKQLDFGHLKQVKHGLAERRYLLANAPHLAKPLGIITPVNSWLEGLYFTIGLKLYSWFAPKDGFPKSEWLSKNQTLAFSPDLPKKTHSSVMYFDGQLDDARYNLAIVQSTDKLGATVANYVAFEKFEFDAHQKITAAEVKDNITGQNFRLKSKLFINCTGPFADHLRIAANPAETPRIKPSKGVHIVIPKHFFRGEKAMLIPKTKDGRLVFVIPFKSEIMVGTTDTPYPNLNNEPTLEKQEIDFLIDTLTPFLEKKPTFNDIKAGFGGIRPLITMKSNDKKQTKSLLRDHEVEVDSQSGLISLLGGKWTTYRLMAEDTVDEICRQLGVHKTCATHEYKLFGGGAFNSASSKHIGSDTLTHLEETYGDQCPQIIKLVDHDPTLAEKIIEPFPFIKAQIVYACQHEMAIRPRDFLARRIRLEILDWKACFASIETVANEMAKALNWSPQQTQEEIRTYRLLIQDFQKQTTH
jgi:glycerol-3-phosphate dehydrogenase